MKFENINSFNEYTNMRPSRHDMIDIGAYSQDFLLSSPPVYPQFYRVSIKYGLENDRTKGYMYFSSPDHPIEWDTPVPWSGYFINITEELISNNQHLDYSFLNYGLHEPLFLKEEEEFTITQLFKEALKEYDKENFSIDILSAYCNLMFAHIAQFYKRQFGESKEQYSQLTDDFFRLLKSYYNQNSDKIINQPTVNHLADQLNITPNYLGDIIKFYTGKPASEHIHQHIISTAKTLLLSQKKASVSEIAYRLGFEYPNYFARLFRKNVGLSPSKFRNQ